MAYTKIPSDSLVQQRYVSGSTVTLDDTTPIIPKSSPPLIQCSWRTSIDKATIPLFRTMRFLTSSSTHNTIVLPPANGAGLFQDFWVHNLGKYDLKICAYGTTTPFVTIPVDPTAGCNSYYIYSYDISTPAGEWQASPMGCKINYYQVDKISGTGLIALGDPPRLTRRIPVTIINNNTTFTQIVNQGMYYMPSGTGNGSNITSSLPNSASIAGQSFYVSIASSDGSLVLTPASSDKINFSTSSFTINSGKSFYFLATPTNGWVAINYTAPPSPTNYKPIYYPPVSVNGSTAPITTNISFGTQTGDVPLPPPNSSIILGSGCSTVTFNQIPPQTQGYYLYNASNQNVIIGTSVSGAQINGYKPSSFTTPDYGSGNTAFNPPYLSIAAKTGVTVFSDGKYLWLPEIGQSSGMFSSGTVQEYRKGINYINAVNMGEVNSYGSLQVMSGNTEGSKSYPALVLWTSSTAPNNTQYPGFFGFLGNFITSEAGYPVVLTASNNIGAYTTIKVNNVTTSQGSKYGFGYGVTASTVFKAFFDGDAYWTIPYFSDQS